MPGADFKKVFDRIRTLPVIRADDIDALREAAGRKVGATERAKIRELVRQRFDAFTDDAGPRLVSQFATSLPNAARLESLGQEKLDVREASGVAPLSGGRMLAVDDARGVYFVDAKGKGHALVSATNEDHPHFAPELVDLEGIAINESETEIFVVSEKTRCIFRIPLSDTEDGLVPGKVEALGTLPRMNDGDVNGWEGLEIIPGRFLLPPGAPAGRRPPGDVLACVHEAEPTRVAFVAVPKNGRGDRPLEVVREMRIPHDARAHLLDFSDITVDPETGHLFVLSDRSQTIVELQPIMKSTALRGGIVDCSELRLVGVTDIPNADGTKPEGIGFDPDNGQLVVVAEKSRKSRIQRFEVHRAQDSGKE